MTALHDAPLWSSSGGSSVELTLFAGSVRPLAIADKIAAARAGGFTTVSLLPIDVRRAADAGTPAVELRRRFEDAGVAVAAVEPLTRWLPSWSEPDGLAADDPTFGGFEPEEVFAMAAELGAELVGVTAVYDPRVDPADGAPVFAELCNRAGGHGLRLMLEFVHGAGVCDLAQAWEIVRDADRPNGGLLIDSWHTARTGADVGLLAAIPPERVYGIQLGDGPAESADDVVQESLHRRRPPGEGDLQPDEVLAALPALTGRLIGPEVFSDSLWRLTPEALGTRLGDATRALLRDCAYGDYGS